MWLKPGGLAKGQGAGQQARTLVAETGAVTCLDRAGRRQRIVEHLPHVLYSGSGESIGPTDVAQLEGRFYVLR